MLDFDNTTLTSFLNTDYVREKDNQINTIINRTKELVKCRYIATFATLIILMLQTIHFISRTAPAVYRFGSYGVLGACIILAFINLAIAQVFHLIYGIPLKLYIKLNKVKLIELETESLVFTNIYGVFTELNDRQSKIIGLGNSKVRLLTGEYKGSKRINVDVNLQLEQGKKNELFFYDDHIVCRLAEGVKDNLEVIEAEVDAVGVWELIRPQTLEEIAESYNSELLRYFAIKEEPYDDMDDIDEYDE